MTPNGTTIHRRFIPPALACILICVSSTVDGGWLDPRFDLGGANGTIASLVEFHGALYAVGGFTRIAGVDAPGLARWNGAKWEAIQPGLNASVYSAVATDEAIYFAPGLLRWDGQSWTLLGNPEGYREVLGHALLSNGTDIYCEAFPEPGTAGLNANKAVAKWNGNAWSILGITSSIGGSGLYSFAFARGELYGSGALYDPSNPQQSLNLGRLVTPNWLPVGGGVNAGLSVFDIASDGTNLLIQGSFTVAGDQPADGFAVWDGSQWIAPAAVSRGNTRVDALTSNRGEVLASEILSTNGAPWGELLAQYLVQYVGTNRTVLARGDASRMKLMRRGRDGVYCTGDFRAVGGAPTGNLAVWNGTNWNRVGEGAFHGLSAAATCLAVAGTNVFAGGAFEYAGETAAKHIARWDGRRWHPLGSGVGGTVVQMATRGDELFVIGAFTSAGGVPATNVARWSAGAWSGLSSGLTGTLNAIAATEGEVLVARTLDYTNFFISRWDGTNWSDLAGGSFSYESIFTIMPMGDSIVIGGSFERINGVVMNNIARWNGTQWQSLGQGVSGHAPWMPNDYPFAVVNAMLLDGTNLYVAGSFTNASGVSASNVARWDGSDWSAMGAGIPGFASCLFGDCLYPVTSLALVKGKLFAGGGFENRFVDSRGHLAMWDGMSWSNVFDGQWSVDGAPYNYGGIGQLHVWALGAHGAELYIAGNFAGIGSSPSYGFAIWHEGPAPVIHSALTNRQVALSWPRDFQSAALESTESLAPPAWNPVTGVTWEISGSLTNNVRVEVPPAGLGKFFRLRW